VRALLVAALLAATAHAEPPAPTGGELLRKYAGSDDTDALLREPAIRSELAPLLGSELEHFERNLFVRGSVDVVSGSLSLSGNAPHGGTEEEAVLCVATYGGAVSAAILSGGAITVYSRTPDYGAQTRCIKDWITQANSGHRDRFERPANVRLAAPR